jgi:hypothetical protein
MTNWRPKTGNRVFKAWKEWKKGEWIIGRYIAQGENVSKRYGTQNWYDIQILKTGCSGIDKNVLFRANGNGALNSTLLGEEFGILVKLEYDGKQSYEDKQTGEDVEYHAVLVSVADENENVADSSSEPDFSDL